MMRKIRKPMRQKIFLSFRRPYFLPVIDAMGSPNYVREVKKPLRKGEVFWVCFFGPETLNKHCAKQTGLKGNWPKRNPTER